MDLQPGSVVATGILHAAIAVMDQASRRRPAGCDRHVERLDRQLGTQRRRQCPADHLAAERVEDHRQIDERFGEMDVGDVRHPQLIKPRELHPPCQVRHHTPAMPAIGRHRHERLAPQTQQIVLTHQPQHTLVVRLPPLAPEQGRDPAITVAPVGQRKPLDRIPQPGLLTARCRCLCCEAWTSS